MAGPQVKTDIQPVRGAGGASGGSLDVSIPNFGGTVALNQGVQSFGIDLDKIGAELTKIQLQSDSIKLVKTEGQVMKDTASAVDALDPLDKDYNKKVSDIYSSASQDAMENSGVVTREAKTELEGRLQRIENVGQMAALGRQKASVQADAIQTFQTNSNGMLTQVRKDPGNADAYFKGFQADAPGLMAGISPDEQRKQLFKLKGEVVLNSALGFADKGQFDQGKAVIDAHAGDLNDQQKSSYTYQATAIEGRMRAAAARAQTGAAADISAQIMDWQTGQGKWDAKTGDPTAPPPVTRDQLQGMRGQFGENPGAWNSLVHQYDSAVVMKQRQEQAGLIADAHAANHSLPNQEMNDLAFQRSMDIPGKKPVAPMSADGINAAADWARDQGFVPTMYKAIVDNAGKIAGSGQATDQDVQRLALATDIKNTIDERAPNTKWGFGDDKSAATERVQAMAKDRQISTLEAARVVLAMTPRDVATETARGTQFNELVKKDAGTGVTTTDYAAKQFQSILGTGFVGRVASGDFSGSMHVLPEDRDAYLKKYETEFKNLGDKDAAKSVADKWVKDNYQVSRASSDGVPRATRYAPESFIDPSVAARVTQMPGGATALIKADVEHSLEISGMKGQEWRLQPDSITERQASQWQAAGTSPDGTSHRQPVTWRLQVKDAFGMFQPVDGPRYMLPPATQINSNPVFQQYNETQKMRTVDEPGAAEDIRRNQRSSLPPSATAPIPEGADTRLKNVAPDVLKFMGRALPKSKKEK